MTIIPKRPRLLGEPALLLDLRTVFSTPGSGRTSQYGAFIRGSDTHDSVAGLLRLFRRRLGITQREAASRLGVAWYTYLRWESKEMLPTQKRLKPLSDAFHLTLMESGVLRNALLQEKAEKNKYRAELSRVCQKYVSKPRGKTTTPEEKRNDTRLRVQRKRDRDFLKKIGLLRPDGKETPEFRELAEKAEAGYPDRRLTPKLRLVIRRFRANKPKPLNYRTGRRLTTGTGSGTLSAVARQPSGVPVPCQNPSNPVLRLSTAFSPPWTQPNC